MSINFSIFISTREQLKKTYSFVTNLNNAFEKLLQMDDLEENNEKSNAIITLAPSVRTGNSSAVVGTAPVKPTSTLNTTSDDKPQVIRDATHSIPAPAK